jgi:predicted transcriptional regulator
MSAQTTTASLLGIPQHTEFRPGFVDFDALLHRRKRREVRSQDKILVAILEACRTPTVQHWIMVKARLGYDTFWKHMNELVALGMMDTKNDGHKTLYFINARGLSLLKELGESSPMHAVAVGP